MSNVTWTGGTEHWTKKGDVKLFLWEKKAARGVPHAGTILFVHGSSMASQPTFDLSVPGRPYSSVMDWFNERGFDTWTMDNEGYGRSDKTRDINCDISNGADDLLAGGTQVSDPLWRMPLWQPYAEMLSSDVADLGNMADAPMGGAVTAALFLQKFVPAETPWAHLDTFAWRASAKPGRPKGGDALGLRAAWEMLKQRHQK